MIGRGRGTTRCWSTSTNSPCAAASPGTRLTSRIENQHRSHRRNVAIIGRVLIKRFQVARRGPNFETLFRRPKFPEPAALASTSSFGALPGGQIVELRRLWGHGRMGTRARPCGAIVSIVHRSAAKACPQLLPPRPGNDEVNCEQRSRGLGDWKANAPNDHAHSPRSNCGRVELVGSVKRARKRLAIAITSTTRADTSITMIAPTAMHQRGRISLESESKLLAPAQFNLMTFADETCARKNSRFRSSNPAIGRVMNCERE